MASRTRPSRRGAVHSEGGPTPGSAADESPPPDPESVARGLLLRRLTASPATRVQLADMLASRGIPGDIADRLLDRFEEVGLVDDAAYARLWVESRRTGRGLAKRALRQELVRKGVDRSVIDDSLEAVSADDERLTAQQLVKRKLRSTAGLDRQARIRRLVGMLARRGFSPAMSMAVVLEALGGEIEGDPVADD